ncbi:hypothetical protein [Heyndrickxia ginsengihumi]|uniref:hypothetical protein n=1 Tax=Heyndrickxia ginsengihumi TaxID=363870 RepID=UPI0004719983|nr:hypothetical protein [Heyndrickxia ginsengihumi]
MAKQYKFVDPQVTRREIGQELVKGLERSLNDQEIDAIYWLGDADYKTRGVLLDLFKELNERIEYFKKK